MFQRIWQQLLHLWRRIKQVFIKSPPPPTPRKQAPDPIACEQKFMQLLEGVASGWSRGEIKGFLIGTNIKDADWIDWLEEFGSRLLASPTLYVELGQRLVLLGEANCGKVSDVAGKIGRELVVRDFRQEIRVKTTEIRGNNAATVRRYQRFLSNSKL